jgi:hypothetical protein
MTERYTFANTPTGLTLMLRTTVSLRRAGFKTHASKSVFHGFTIYTLTATAAPRPNRRERGCTIERGI